MRLFAQVLVCALVLPGTLARAGEDRKGIKAPFFFVSTYNPDTCGTKRVFLDRLVGEKAEDPKKVLLISFFNIDCKPCKRELPYLQTLYEHYKKKGLGLLVVNCDYRKEKIDAMVEYIKESGFTFPVLKDRFQALQRRYGVESFPTMFILDTSGVINDIRVGYNEKKMPFPLADIQRRLGVPDEPITEKKKVKYTL